MSLSWYNLPPVRSRLFYPRPDRPIHGDQGATRDGVFAISDNTESVQIGYRFYEHTGESPVIVFWHGNGEIASDYDDVVAYFHRAGAALLVIDFRGYGWSSGQPGVDELLHDAEAVCPLLAGVVGERPLYAMGRSMGGAAAIQAVYRNPNTFRGLILESTFAGIVPVVKRIVAIPMVTGILNEPLDSVGKMPHITLPLRIIHGEADSLIPVEHAHQLYNAAGSTDKRLVTIPRAGHNDIMMRDMRLYFDTIQAFVGSG